MRRLHDASPARVGMSGLTALLLHWLISSWVEKRSCISCTLCFAHYAGVCLASPVAPTMMSQGVSALRTVCLDTKAPAELLKSDQLSAVGCVVLWIE